MNVQTFTKRALLRAIRVRGGGVGGREAFSQPALKPLSILLSPLRSGLIWAIIFRQFSCSSLSARAEVPQSAPTQHLKPSSLQKKNHNNKILLTTTLVECLFFLSSFLSLSSLESDIMEIIFVCFWQLKIYHE